MSGNFYGSYEYIIYHKFIGVKFDTTSLIVPWVDRFQLFGLIKMRDYYYLCEIYPHTWYKKHVENASSGIQTYLGTRESNFISTRLKVSNKKAI